MNVGLIRNKSTQAISKKKGYSAKGDKIGVESALYIVEYAFTFLIFSLLG